MLDNPYLDNELYIYSYFTDKRYGNFSLRNDSLYREQCRSYPVPVVDVHLFPVRPQRVHHLGIPRSYRQNQGRVSILSISKRWLMRIQRSRFKMKKMQYKGYNSDFSPCWGRWYRRRKTGGSPWPPRGGSVWPASVGYCRPVSHTENVQSVYACIHGIGLLFISLLYRYIHIYNYYFSFTVMRIYNNQMEFLFFS